MSVKLNNLSDMKAEMAASGRVVLLRHSVTETFRQISVRGDHFDLMIQPTADAKLWTWALDQNILGADFSSGPIAAQRLPDHRRMYLEFEGPISGQRGSVTQIFSGSYRLLEAPTGMNLRIEAGQSSPVDISGVLVILQSDAGSWEFEFRPD